METDAELTRLLEKKAREFFKKAKRELCPEEVGPENKHGIYLLDWGEKCWRLVRIEGEPLKLGEFGDGPYLIYFDNTKCPACRRYDPHWFKFIEDHWDKLRKENYHIIIVLCEWFARRCQSKAAAATFLEYKVIASPTTLIAYTEKGKTVYQEKYEGVLTYNELKLVIDGFVERAMKAAKGEPVTPPLRERIAREPSEKLIELLRKLLGLSV